MEERKIHCGKYNECLDAAVFRKGNFNCAGCEDYEGPQLESVSEFEEELTGGQRIKAKGEEEMTAKGKGPNQGKTCDVTGCDNDAYCKGKCVMHYSRIKRGAALEGGPRQPGRQPKEKTDSPITKTRKDESTKKERGAYKPKRPKASEQLPLNSSLSGAEAGELERVQRTVKLLIVAGAVSEEKVKQAYEIAGWK